MLKRIMFIALLSLTGCHHGNNQVSKLWFYTYSNEETDSTLNPLSFIDLKKDGSYTSDFGLFEQGKWVYEDHWIKLTNSNKKITLLKVDTLSGNEMKLRFKGIIENFESQPVSATEAKNPFSAGNNLWQIPAVKKENFPGIKNRIINHIKFWQVYFAWALDNEINYIDVRSMPTPFKIYGNGFTLKPYNDLPNKWISYFYDSAECRIANGFLAYVMRNNQLAWPHTDNKFKAFISVFQQLELKVKTSKFIYGEVVKDSL